ncbi:CHAT domain-containing protein [Moorena producens PAL-8-15-08-1]|uniref:CHAT domain-containing protein n=1 Tax=Moorena producens PAL-8-15-08-1 TaxID=1458985 RepID=A0A1D8TQM8_9CYAN|nr:CHAT domain-containing protein [Moorena producens]AOW99882.1 CHAT domain-containing protein [Moorena producens PAL-8-15-08-1]
MKRIATSFSWFLATLHFTGTISALSVQAQVTRPMSNHTGSNALTHQTIAQSPAVNPPNFGTALDNNQVVEAVPLIEQTWEKQYQHHLDINFPEQSITVKEIANTLGKITNQTGQKPGLIYMVPRSHQLELVLITPEGKPIHKRVSAANKEALLSLVQEFIQTITHPMRRHTKDYLPVAQQLYQWMIEPVEPYLKNQGIDNLIFCLGGGLRHLPFAALHDGQEFLVQKYSLALIPAFKLTDTVYSDLKNSQVLAMGASEFNEHNSLPAVPIELSVITQYPWQGKSFLNRKFTINNLKWQQRYNKNYKILHLATHSDFKAGKPSQSYIQFWDSKLTLEEFTELRWHSPTIELLVLSSCRTAIGDKEAELGFAGLAVRANVKSAVASLWYVSDGGTLVLMSEFYRSLKTVPIKAEALRQAQIGMLKQKVSLASVTDRPNVSLPPELASLNYEDLSHPYYWAAFTVVGNPW